ncbi:hypothetical protein QJQ45_000364 [Haematococcus lacustris]|nr:hypothetical protein QJQ45_000364 [Haematococcus lacustris]
MAPGRNRSSQVASVLGNAGQLASAAAPALASWPDRPHQLDPSHTGSWQGQARGAGGFQHDQGLEEELYSRDPSSPRARPRPDIQPQYLSHSSPVQAWQLRASLPTNTLPAQGQAPGGWGGWQQEQGQGRGAHLALQPAPAADSPQARRAGDAAPGTLRSAQDGAHRPGLDVPFGTTRTLQEQVARSQAMEDHLIKLCAEKSKLEAEFAKLPSHGRNGRDRARKVEVEGRLEELNRDISTLRLALKKLQPKYEGLKALPSIGKEYQQGYKRVNDRLPKARQRLHRAAEYRRGIDGRARNNAWALQGSQCSLGAWEQATGQLVADKLDRWKLTKGQVKHGSGLNNARRTTQRWLAPIQPHLQHLAAASSAGTSLEANLKQITVTLATWDTVWEVYLDPKWARQRLRLCRAQDRALEQFFKKLEEDMVEMSMERHGHAKQLVVFFGAASMGTGGGWGADAVLRACCKVVCRPRDAGQRRGRVVLVDEHRATRVSSAVNGQQPCEEELNKLSATRPAGWKPPAGQVERRLVRPAWSQRRDQPVRGLMWCPVVAPRKPPQAPCSSQEATQPAASEPRPSTPPPAKRSKHTKAEQAAELAAERTQPAKCEGEGKGKAAKDKLTPQPGRWLDRDCKAALNMQRIGESRWRPLELCYWPEQGALPAKGKEYPGLGYKRLRDKPPKAQQQQQQPAEAQ